MAYVANMDEDEDKTGNGPVAPAGGGSVSIAPSSGVGQTGSTGTPAASKAGGSFATIQNYVDANQGQAQPLANKITSGITNQYNDLNNQNQGVINDLNSQVGQGYTKYNGNLLNAENTNPSAFVSEGPANVSGFKGQLTDTYTGPSSAESSGNYTGQVANLNQAINTGKNQVGTEAGRQQLLQQNEATPNQSVTGLNEAILSKDPNAQASIENAYVPFGGLLNQLSTGAGGVDTNIANAQSEAAKAASQAQGQLTNQGTNLTNTLNNELAQGQTNAKNYQNFITGQENTGVQNVNNALNAFNTSLQAAPEKDIFGVNGAPVDLFLNNSNILSAVGQGATLPGAQYNTAPPTMANVATPYDFGTANALSQLGGPAYTNPLAGVTPQAYNPLTTNPSLQSMTAPLTTNLENAFNNYGKMPNFPGPPPAPNGQPYAPFITPGNPLETLSGAGAQNYVNSQYQNLLNQLSQIYGSTQTPDYGNYNANPQLATPATPPTYGFNNETLKPYGG